MSSPRDFRAESVTAILACGQPEAASEETGGAVRMRSVQGPHRLSPLCLLTGTSHSVKQLQFTKWPDHGTPASADSFITYVRYARKSHLTGPMIVHCSAGIGRSGVFVCADVVFCAIVKNCSFNIMDIVAQMREQRSGMVQTREQYHFCYSIVLEVLRKLLTLD
ncbi:tyrosine-protein phosphatase non-receptor type 20 isoform X5 [Sapajus apella]|uniref:Tyrosine-protein phosphatase non-receptor type 20 isoform X5 n=2 Tax=Sapajus apella TaxID=9515 RepID=A0A6J3GXZ2_SAPAP|nr:tyrosine-protein phosphatase non-receptor type 20 isoform X5 [Sapajus apella]